MLRIEWADEELFLLHEKAVFWPRRRTLLIADPHFGKAATFRQAGIPVPGGTTEASLRRLDEALRRAAADRLVILGDFLHARTGRSVETLAALEAWRRRNRRLEVVLVEGNHDRHAGSPPEALRIETVAQPLVEPPFALIHEPQAHEGLHGLAGHVHPGVALADGTGALRLACFLLGDRAGLLPAFGAFTGMRAVRPRAGDRVFVVGPDEVVEVGRAGRRQMLKD